MPALLHLFAHTSTPKKLEKKLASIASIEEDMSLSLASEKRKRRSVSFFDQVVVFEHLNRKEISEDEHCRCWYNRAELHQINGENNATVGRMMAGSMGGKQWCSRGLEARTPTGARLRQKHRRDALGAVLEYQSLECESGVERNVDRIAQVYTSNTKQSAQVAQLMAAIDAQVVEGDRITAVAWTTTTTTTAPNRFLTHPSTANSPSPISVRA